MSAADTTHRRSHGQVAIGDSPGRDARATNHAVAKPNARWDGIFLDLYGTITAGDRAAVHAACERVVADLRLPVTADEFAAQWGEGFFALLDRSNHDAFRTLHECEIESLIDTAALHGRTIDPAPYVAVLEEYWSNPPIHPEVRDALANLSLPICLVSNADTAHAQAAIVAHGLEFAHVVTSEEARCYKPCPAIFEFALRRTGWRPERVIHVGDSLHSDIKGARDAGLHTGWVCRDIRIHDIGNCQPHHTFRDLHDLAALLLAT